MAAIIPTMTTRKGRGPPPGAIPTPAQIRAAREAAGLTQAAAAEVVYATLRTWQNWEASGAAGRAMHPAIWELWLMKTAHLRR